MVVLIVEVVVVVVVVGVVSENTLGGIICGPSPQTP